MSLRALLRWMIWWTVLPLMALAAYFAIVHVHAVQDLQKDEANNLANNVAVALDHHIEWQIAGLEILADSPLIDDSSRLDQFYRATQSFVQNLGGDVILADMSMQMIFNTRVPFGTTLPKLPRPSGRAAAPTALETGRPAVGDVFLGPIAHKLFVAIAVPIIRDGRIVFLLLAIVETDRFQEQLNKILVPPEWAIAIRDSTGKPIATRSPRGVEVFSVNGPNSERFAAELTFAPWSVQVEIPREVYREPVFMTAAAMSTAVLLAAFTSILGATVAGRWLSRSMKTLTEPTPLPKWPTIPEIENIRRMLTSANAAREATMLGTIHSMSSMMDKRDPYTAGHERRVGSLARAIGAEIGLTEDRLKGLELTGLVHDVGKISVPAEILSKPRRLTDIEYAIVKQHPLTGHEIVKDVAFPWPVAETILQHHERLDGSGYPRGLKNGEIILEARIIAVADVVEAMASHRPYRPTLGIDAALDEIGANGGKLYDPEVVACCLRLFREKGYALPS